MRITALCENTSSDDRLTQGHGLSMYIDMDDVHILFDIGPSNIFLDNARVLGIDISSVDMAILSHGHYDHGGGLGTFLEVNSSAPVYMSAKAFGDYYSQRSETVVKYIGLDKSLATNDRLVMLDRDRCLTDGVSTMSGIRHTYATPMNNKSLYEKVGDDYILDTFDHEIDLVIETQSGYTLIVGCAHNGIRNIVEHFGEQYGTMPSHVFGGFHLMSRTGASESDESIDELARYLLSTGAHYHTCHCTGVPQYERMKNIMRDKIDYFSTGSAVDIK